MGMPELPEVEVMRRDLEREIVGKKVKAVDVTGTRAIRRHKNKKQFVDALVDRKFAGVSRKGKYLLCRLQTGQLRFVDPRTFGEMFVTASDTVEQDVSELSHLGIDPIESAMSWELFGHMLRERHAKLKPLLMDQKFIAGIGNIYADEILWGAGLRWDRMSDALTGEEVRRLYRAMVETLQDAVKHRGSSLADAQYVDLFGRPGDFQQFHNVYARDGQSCPRCRHVVVREKVGSRSTFYCSACQV